MKLANRTYFPVLSNYSGHLLHEYSSKCRVAGKWHRAVNQIMNASFITSALAHRASYEQASGCITAASTSLVNAVIISNMIMNALKRQAVSTDVCGH